MKCLHCKSEKRKRVKKAEYVFWGKSMCEEHAEKSITNFRKESQEK